MIKCGTCMKKVLPKNNPPDYLTPLLEVAPAAWALIRANEIRVLDRVKFEHPNLDVGCGNGIVAKVILSKRNEKFDWGIDLSAKEISYAKKSGSYKKCKVASVYNLPFKDGEFACVFSNSVIEHIPDLDKALNEISRVLKKNGEFVITVPSPYLTQYLWGYQFFKSIRLKILAKLYGKLFNFSFKHYNLYSHKSWEKILKKYSFKLIDHHYYHTKGMIQIHELLAYLAIPYHFSKAIFGYWVVFPKIRSLLIVPWLRKLLYGLYLADSKRNEGGSVFLIAKKIS